MLSIFKARAARNADRSAARQSRILRWDQPLTGKRQRLRAWLNMLFIDHGIIRLVYVNERSVAPGFSRSAQPAPHDVKRLASAGLKTIVNLRGGREHGAWTLQREACERHGVELREITIRSRGAPDKETLLSLPAFFASLRYPALAHCKSGADRAGLFSALYLLVKENRPVAEAKKQLALRYGHVRFAKTGVLDAFLEAFEREGEAKGLSFMEWVEQVYDPARVEAEFHEGFWASLLVDKVMRRE